MGGITRQFFEGIKKAGPVWIVGEFAIKFLYAPDKLRFASEEVAEYAILPVLCDTQAKKVYDGSITLAGHHEGAA